ncbi:MAG: hypothetical protein Q9200_005799 [Gallowayella weberi]
MGCTKSLTGEIACKGRIRELGSYNLLIKDYQLDESTSKESSAKSLTVLSNEIWQAISILSNELKRHSSQAGLLEDQAGRGNLQFVQKKFEGMFEFDVFFSLNSSSQPLMSDSITKGTSDGLSWFQKRFGMVYAPHEPFTSTVHTEFSRYLLSNLLGGIGYFHGKSRVDDSSAQAYSETELKFWEKAAAARAHSVVQDDGPHELLSAVPSRPFFPRGFLWDEGFHLQVILDWDMDLALEIVSSWFQLMDDDGWIAREQILGPEARSKVPPEFQVQYSHYANPPTLFFVIAAFLGHLEKASSYRATKYFHHSRLPMARSHTSTLTSGLDDYPRAQPPHPEELHVDALSWVGTMAKTLKKLSVFLREEEDEATFSLQEAEIIRSINDVHWSELDQAYCDTKIAAAEPPKHVCHKGYVSLLPFCLGLVGHDSPHLGAVLNLIRDPEELWSPFGIRSLSIRDKYFGIDEDYWRGPIWMNINYMILDRLLELTQLRGFHQSRASNMWNETGFAWEQYNANTGKGQKTQYFTGWTALIVKIMAVPHFPQGPSTDDNELSSDGISRESLDPQLYIIAMVIAFLVYLFRRRLIKLRRAFFKPANHRSPILSRLSDRCSDVTLYNLQGCRIPNHWGAWAARA